MDIKIAVMIMSIITVFFFILIFKQLKKTRKSIRPKSGINKVNTLKKPMILDLRNYDVGVSCEEYTILIVANPKNMPTYIRERMAQHIESCAYHNSNAFYQSALGIMADDSDLERAVRELIKKYDLETGVIELKKEDGQTLYMT